MYTKKSLISLAAVIATGLSLLGHPGKVQAQDDENVIKVASHLPPMTDIVEIAAKVIEKPYKIELVEVSDNIQYNEAVLNDEAFASFAEHRPFMDIFNQERNGDLVAVQPIYNAVVGFYSPKFKSIDAIEDGTEVAIPSDPTNEARALMILQQNDLIKLKDTGDALVTVDDIEENPLNLKFTTVDLLNLTGAYEDGVGLVFDYPTYIAKLGLKPADALFLEKDKSNTFAISLVMRKGNVDSDKAKALQKAFTSPEVKAFLEDLAKEGHLTLAFGEDSQESDADSNDAANDETKDESGSEADTDSSASVNESSETTTAE